MTTPLSTEMFWLVITTTMTGLFWIPYILNRLLEQGILNGLWDPHGCTDTSKAWARRMMQAHANAIENLAIFAPLVLAVQLTGSNSSATATACMIYFFARLVHYLAFSFAIPILRVLTFLAGVGAQLLIASVLLGPVLY